MLQNLGHQLSFYARSLGWTARTIRRYPKEVLRLLSEVSLGSGALALIGGTVVVVGFLTAVASRLGCRATPRSATSASAHSPASLRRT